MWRKFLLLFGIAGVLTGCGTTWNETDSEGLPHGPWIEYSADSVFFSVMEYDHGQKVGQETIYYARDTAIYIQRHWAYDSTNSYTELNGAYYHFQPNGVPVMEGFYRFGQPDSTVLHYDKEGEVRIEGQYDVGVKTGIWYYYDKAGSLTRTINYTDHPQGWQEDLKHGVYTYYAGGIQPAYQVEWFHESKIRDSILDTTSYGLLLQEGVIDTSQYLP